MSTSASFAVMVRRVLGKDFSVVGTPPVLGRGLFSVWGVSAEFGLTRPLSFNLQLQ
jgi:hypothetical protein